MRSSQQRVATLVVCTPTGETLGQMPPFEPELPWWQDAEGLVRWVRERHSVEVTVLRLLEAALPAPPGGEVTYLVETSDPRARNMSLAPWIGSLEGHPLRLVYAEPGGPARDLEWAASALEERGFRRSGPAEQVRTWNLSSLWRIPVEGETLWLKCVPPFFAHEGEILTRLQGASVPTLVAHASGRILMREIAGEDQYDAGPRALQALVSILVGLQTQWSGRDEELLALGLPDWRAAALSEAIESVVRRTAPDLSDADVRALDYMVDGLPERFAGLRECGVPDSLVHGDFSPGNSRGDGTELVLLDWGDCGVGHPLLDQSAFMDRTSSEAHPQVFDHWHNAWRLAVPGSDPARAVELLTPVAAARQAVTYQGFLDRIEPSEHPYHRADPALWLRRAAGLARGAAGIKPRRGPDRNAGGVTP